MTWILGTVCVAIVIGAVLVGRDMRNHSRHLGRWSESGLTLAKMVALLEKGGDQDEASLKVELQKYDTLLENPEYNASTDAGP